jgi:hypothetical protein
VNRGARVDLVIATGQYPLLATIAGGLVLLGVVGVSIAGRGTAKPGEQKSHRPASKLRPEIKLKPRADIGKSHVDSARRLETGMEIRLRPVSDAGRQSVITDARIIEEESEHD